MNRNVAQPGLARLTGGQKVESSNLSVPTIKKAVAPTCYGLSFSQDNAFGATPRVSVNYTYSRIFQLFHLSHFRTFPGRSLIHGDVRPLLPPPDIPVLRHQPPDHPSRCITSTGSQASQSPPPTYRNQLEASVSDKLVELQLKRSD